jgi:hypothetical protein
MPEIKLTQQEFDLLRSYFEYELEEAQQYIKQLKSIIRKLNAYDKPTIVHPIPATQGIEKSTEKKIGHPAEVTVEAHVKTEAPKPKAKRGRPKKVMGDQLESMSSKPLPAAPPKPRRKRKSNYRQQGVFLTSLSKPLPKLPEDDIGLPYGSKNTQIL